MTKINLKIYCNTQQNSNIIFYTPRKNNARSHRAQKRSLIAKAILGSESISKDENLHNLELINKIFL